MARKANEAIKQSNVVVVAESPYWIIRSLRIQCLVRRRISVQLGPKGHLPPAGDYVAMLQKWSLFVRYGGDFRIGSDHFPSSNLGLGQRLPFRIVQRSNFDGNDSTRFKQPLSASV